MPSSIFGFRRITVSPAHCAIKFFDGRINAITGPGVISRFLPSGRREFLLVDVSEPEMTLANIESHLRDPNGKLAEHIDAVDFAPDQLGLVYKQARFSNILPPGARAVLEKNRAN